MRVTAFNTGDYHRHPEEIFTQWFEESILTRIDYESVRKFRCDIFLREIEVGAVDEFFSWHIDSIPGIERPDEYETDENASGEFQTVCEERAEFEGERTLCITRRFLFCECIENDCQSEQREEEYGRDFGELCEAEENAGDDDVLETRIFQETDEKIECEKKECSDTDISRDIMIVA